MLREKPELRVLQALLVLRELPEPQALRERREVPVRPGSPGRQVQLVPVVRSEQRAFRERRARRVRRERSAQRELVDPLESLVLQELREQLDRLALRGLRVRQVLLARREQPDLMESSTPQVLLLAAQAWATDGTTSIRGSSSSTTTDTGSRLALALLVLLVQPDHPGRREQSVRPALQVRPDREQLESLVQQGRRELSEQREPPERRERQVSRARRAPSERLGSQVRRDRPG